MPMNHTKNSRKSRLPLAITLVTASFISAFLIATTSNKGEDFWAISAQVNPGHVLTKQDLKIIRINLGESAHLYLERSEEPIGMVVTRNFSTGQLLAHSDLTSSQDALTTSAVPISVRAVDLAKGLVVGEGVDIYWVLDSRNGEAVIDPILILGGVTLLNFQEAGNSFGAEVGLTIAVEETQVLRMLSATTQGRLVVVRSHV